MIGKTGALQLGGASVLAIVAASVLMPSEARACQATSGTDQNGDPIVSIACDPDDPPVAPFTTRYVNASGILISTGNGNDALTMTGGAIVDGAAGTPGVDIDTSDVLDASDGIVDMLGGNDIVIISAGQIGSPQVPVSLSLGDGTDTFNMSGGTLNGSVFGGAGDDDIEVSGNAIITGVPGFSAAIETGAGNNEVRILGGTIGTDPTQLAIFLEDGANIFDMSGGVVNGNIVGQGGEIAIHLAAASSTVFCPPAAGTTRSSSPAARSPVTSPARAATTRSPSPAAPSVQPWPATTARIQSQSRRLDRRRCRGRDGHPHRRQHRRQHRRDHRQYPRHQRFPVAAPLDLRSGVVFSGTNAAATIINTDLAAGGTKTQVFSGFDSVTAANSTLAFGASVIDIGTLSLTNGSTLFVNGNVDPDFVSVTNSTISLIDGAADDVFTLGGLALNNVTLGFDVDQQTSTADRIVATTLSATGTNIVNVNLLGAPVFARQTDIPIIVSGGPVAGTFVAQGLPGTQASLFTYQENIE